MQRYNQSHMDVHPDGEWIRYADHCEAMKRIAAPAPSASPAALTDEVRAILQSVLDHDQRICSGLIARKVQTPNNAQHQAAKADQKSWDAVANRIRALLAASPADQGEDARDQLAALVDIYDDAMNNPPESRAYVDGAFKQQMDEARNFIAMSASKEGGNV